MENMNRLSLEVKQPGEAIEAMQKMAAAAVEPKITDEAVWLSVYTAVANAFNSDRSAACRWADGGLEEFKKRFRK